MKSKEKILVIGAGAWGSALANLLAKNSYEVFLSSNSAEIAKEISSKNTNQKFLPDIKLSSKIKAKENFLENFSEKMSSIDSIFIVVPSHAAKEVFTQISTLNSQNKISKNCKFVICSKGFENQSLLLLGDAFKEVSGIKNYCVLSGPNFAIEVAKNLPTITTIASEDKNLADKIITLLNNKHFKAIYFNDPRTVEICGIVKNIIAIGCGIVEGLELGANVKSALIVKGIEEVQILCNAVKASTDLAHAAGFGDIFLTCSSLKSRNNTLGTMLAKGKTYEEISQETKKTYEGKFSAQNLSLVAKQKKVELTLCDTIHKILSKTSAPFSSQQIQKEIIKAIL